jgi:hypothetical protein
MKKCTEVQAVEALRALLRQVSAVRIRDIKVESHGPKQRKDILARIDVYGHQHTLFCKVTANGEARNVQTVLGELRERTRQPDEEITPVLIAPLLSTEAQTLCRQRRLGFLDLEGNAHLELNEFFFGMRSLPRQAALQQ